MDTNETPSDQSQLSENNNAQMDVDLTNVEQNESELDEQYPPILNGTYFRVKEELENGNITSTCVTCESENAGIPEELRKPCDYKGCRRAKSIFFTHLKRVHPEVLAEFEDQNPRKKRKITFDGYQFIDIERKQDETNANILNYLLSNFHPPDIINEDFHKIINGINGQLEINDQDELKLRIGNKANQLKKGLLTVLQKVSFINITVTGVEIQSNIYLMIACHWLNPADLRRQDDLLSCKLAGTCSFDVDYILSIVKPVLKEYKMKKNKVSSVIVNCIAFNDTLFSNFINDPDPDEFASPVNFYIFPDAHDATKMDYPAVEIKSHVILDDLKVVNSIHYKIFSVALADLFPILSSKGKKYFHYQTFGKLIVIWNLLKRKPDSVTSIFKDIKAPQLDHIRSLYLAIHQLVEVSDKLNAGAKRLSLPITFSDSEIAYMKDVSKYLKVFAGALEALEEDENCYYGNVAPIIFTIRQRLTKLKLTELSDCQTEIIENFNSTFKAYFKLNETNSSMLAACFHPMFKRNWIPFMDRERIKGICKNLMTEMAESSTPSPVKNIEEPRQTGYVFLTEDTDDPTEGIVNVETSSYFHTKVCKTKQEQQRQLQELPIIKKMFIKYNTQICNSAIVKSLLDRTNIFNIMSTELKERELIDQYCILNIAKEKESIDD